MSSDHETLSARAERSAQIRAEPHLYKVCESCESIIVEEAATCPNCNGYRFDAEAQRVISQAEILGKRLPNSVPPEDLL